MLAYTPNERIVAKDALNHPYFADLNKEASALSRSRCSGPRRRSPLAARLGDAAVRGARNPYD